jgi:hypothetical protein
MHHCGAILRKLRELNQLTMKQAAAKTQGTLPILSFWLH